MVLLYFDPDEFGLFSKVLRQHGAKEGKKGLIDKEPALLLALSKLAQPQALGKSNG